VSPTSKLTVANGCIRSDLNSVGSSLIGTGAGSNFQVVHDGSSFAGLFNSGGGIQIRKPDGITSIASFDLGGSVGIGTSAPNANAKLDVNGNIFTNGKLAIGTTDMTKIGTYALAVKGDAIFNKVKIKNYDGATGWADYVFNNDYELMSLPNLEKYIKANKHLPEVPSAAEVENDGIDIGSTQIILLQKIEELTLYAIEQNKKATAQQEQINILLKELAALKDQQKK